MSKLYKREGRQFIEVPDRRGMYYNNDGTFSKERESDSIAFCVNQSPTDITLCMLKYGENKTWEEAKTFCTKLINGGYLPKIDELLHAYILYRFLFPERGFVWSSTEFYYRTTRMLDLDDGDVNIDIKSSHNQVFAFLKLPV